MKLLIVDDSKLSRLSLIKAIPITFKKNCEILQAENGKEAIFQNKIFKPDVIFLDLTMPEMNGYEVLEVLQQESCHALIYVISVDIQPKAREKVCLLGAKDFIEKPINESKLEAIFESILTQKKD